MIYANGTGTTAEVTNKVEEKGIKDTLTVKFNVNIGNSTVGNDGKAKPTTDQDNNKIAMLADITKTINDTFWKVTSGTDGGSEAEGSQKSEQQIKAGDMVSLKAGKNLTIKQDGANLSDAFKIDNFNVGEKGADGKPVKTVRLALMVRMVCQLCLTGKMLQSD